jgi:hypothetical protein
MALDEHGDSVQHRFHLRVPIGVARGHFHPDNARHSIDDRAPIRRGKHSLGVWRVVHDERRRRGRLSHAKQERDGFVKRGHDPVGENHLHRAWPEDCDALEASQGDLGAHMADADLERQSVCTTFLGQYIADAVKLFLRLSVKLASASIRIYPIEARRRQSRDLVWQPAQVDRVIGIEREEQGTPSASECRRRKWNHE